jgi:undecaprenyl-diphosphatase
VRHPDSAAQRADHDLLAALRRCGADPHVARAAKGLSWTGEHGAVWLAAGLAGAAADPDRRGAWLRATALVAGAHAASMAVKRVVRRPRPELPGAAPLVRTAGRHGFPSSHATSAAAATVAFGALLPRGPVPHLVPRLLPHLVPPLAAAMCVSRLVVGVHYPTDVACGALLGGAVARLGRRWALAGVRDD